MLSLLRQLTVSLILVPGLLWLGLLTFIRFADAPRLWWLDLLDTFALYAFAPFAGVLLAAGLFRSRALGLLAASAGLLFLVEFGSALLPGTPPTEASGPHLKVLTYNLRSPNSDPEPLLEVVRTEQPDVIVLQELTARYAERLRARVGDEYPYFMVAGIETANDGGGVYSRLPILAHEAFRLTDEGNVLQRLRLRTEAGEVWLVNVHLLSPQLERRRVRGRLPMLPLDFHDELRDEELRRLVAVVGNLDGPFVLAGDFNMAAGSRPSRQLPNSWRDAFREAGEGFGHTFPVGMSVPRWRLPITFPLVRIDYVITSPELTPRYARVPRMPGSDHFPVVADLALPASR